MKDRVVAKAFPPGEFLRDELEERGWTQEEFAAIIGRPKALVNQIISGKRGITPETAQEIGAALGTSAIFWMNLESAYRLWNAGPVPARINKEARMRERFPVREMLKRGWLKPFENPDELETQLADFFGLKDIEETPQFLHAAKKSEYPDEINGVQGAWLFRVKQIASALRVAPFSERALRESLERLRLLLATSDGLARIPKILADSGVRFVVVEHVPSSKIDGVCFWLDKQSPVIGMSLRLDRIDNFWFVLRHEIEHVLNGDGKEDSTAVVDIDLMSDSIDQGPIEELRANHAAADFCVPLDEMADFVSRNRPLFSEQRVLNFSARMGVHPGLVVGQIQKRTGNYKLFRKHLIGIRELVTSVAVTDGYGHAVQL